MKQLFNRNNLIIICALALFHFVFLCEEFCFDNLIGVYTSETGVVMAQNITLGASAVGFLCYPLLRKLGTKINMYILSIIFMAICGTCIFLVYAHKSFSVAFASGIVEYLFFGIAGATVYYYAAFTLTDRRQLAKLIGISYALGILLQFLNNNLIVNYLGQTMIIIISLMILVALLHILRKLKVENAQAAYVDKDYHLSNPQRAAIALMLSIALLTCIFSTLDNVVTLVHATGALDIGQWPRLILALSGLMAGYLYDFNSRKYMSHMMYLITILATVCIIVVELGGSFVIGLIMFYISAGFFVVFFTTSFMDLAYEMREPSIWAGMGRAVNNLFAITTSGISIFLLSTDSKMAIVIVTLLLFAAISISLLIYFLQITDRHRATLTTPIIKEQSPANNQLDAFASYFQLTKREKEVLDTLLSSDENMTTLANRLFISRAALYRHINSINAKTNTQNRVALLKFFYEWREEYKQ